MLHSPEKQEEFKAIIRRVLAMNPTITAVRMKEMLASGETPIHLDREYIGKLINQVRLDRIDEINSQTKEDIYGEIRDTVEFVNNQLRAIAQEEKLVYMKTKDGKPVEKAETRIFAQNNRIKAMNSIVDNLMKLTQLRMDLGITERRLGTLDVPLVGLMGALKKIRSGDYRQPLDSFLPALSLPVGAGGDAGAAA